LKKKQKRCNDERKSKEKEYISTLQELNKLVEGKELHIPSNGDNRLRRHISAEEILIAFLIMHNNAEQRLRDKKYRPEQKETFHPFYELDHATAKSLDSELRKMIDTKVYDLLSLENARPENKTGLSTIKKARGYSVKYDGDSISISIGNRFSTPVR
jgi:hypothetical protein